jgi:hypothetical protein
MSSNGTRNSWPALVLGAVAAAPLLSTALPHMDEARAVEARADAADDQLALTPRREQTYKDALTPRREQTRKDDQVSAARADAAEELALGPGQERHLKRAGCAPESSAFQAEHARMQALALALIKRA